MIAPKDFEYIIETAEGEQSEAFSYLCDRLDRFKAHVSQLQTENAVMREALAQVLFLSEFPEAGERIAAVIKKATEKAKIQ